MDNYKKNRKIAEILGFKFIKPNPKKGIDFEQVEYPENWKNEMNASPVTDIPDFIVMLEQGRKIAKMYEFGIPFIYNNSFLQ